MAKFFSLFSSEQVHPAPGEKIIPASEFSKLTTATQIVKKVKSDAKEYIQETTIEGEKIKEQAFKEGFQDGLRSLNAHLLALDEELKVLRSDIQKKILPLALSAARKILGEELKIHPDRIVDIVLNSLKPVTQHRKVAIYLNHEDFEMVEKKRGEIKAIFEHIESISIQERDDIERGGCIIETEAGIINAQLENQWRALESAFESFKREK